jgi:uncharacterized protein
MKPSDPNRSECRCQDCAWKGDEMDCNAIEDLFERVAPGEPMPSGECPTCGALRDLLYTRPPLRSNGGQERRMKRYTMETVTYVRKVPGKGRGVFASCDLPPGKLVLVNDVALIEPDALKKTSKFNDYPMAWSRKYDAIALGPINMLNHSFSPNCRVERFSRERVMECWTVCAIRQGEELTIHYACPLWFKVR